MSKATMELHHNIKKPGAIMFESILVFFGMTIFPGGLILIVFMGFLKSLIDFPDYLAPVIILGLGIIGMVFSILDSIYRNMEIHKKVMIELLYANQALTERNGNEKK